MGSHSAALPNAFKKKTDIHVGDMHTRLTARGLVKDIAKTGD